jgi:type IX secretion system PorP/SprF family membrane protein
MDSKSNIPVIERVFFITIFTLLFCKSEAQQTQLNPISYWIFAPYIYNPAIAGSKDFSSVSINASFQGKSNTQIIYGNTRFRKTQTEYFQSPKVKEFNNFGVGGSVFNDVRDFSRNIGVSASGSYHIPMSPRKLSFLSFGASVKGVYNILDTGTTEKISPTKKTFYPNLDLGIYYFDSNIFAGFSIINILGNPKNPESTEIFSIPVPRQYFFTIGCKIPLSRSLGIVLEPSVLVSSLDTTFNNIQNNINPILKLYIEGFCFGSNFLGNGETSFFFQYRYPRFNIGAFYELPQKSPYYKRTPVVEFTFGLNIHNNKSRVSGVAQW